MNILYLYNAAQNHTNTVFEHLVALSNFSRKFAICYLISIFKLLGLVTLAYFLLFRRLISEQYFMVKEKWNR